MTPAELNAIEGRELDALYAEVVRGWVWITFHAFGHTSIMVPSQDDANEIAFNGSSWTKDRTGEPDLDGATFQKYWKLPLWDLDFIRNDELEAVEKFGKAKFLAAYLHPASEYDISHGGSIKPHYAVCLALADAPARMRALIWLHQENTK